MLRAALGGGGVTYGSPGTRPPGWLRAAEALTTSLSENRKVAPQEVPSR